MTTLELGAENLEATVAEHEIVLVDSGPRGVARRASSRPSTSGRAGNHPGIAFAKVDTEAEPAPVRGRP